MAVFDAPNAADKSSGTIGYEVINDRRRKDRNSPNFRRSTPDSGRFLHSQETSRSRERRQSFHEDPSLTPIHPIIVPRLIKKRSKKNSMVSKLSVENNASILF